ncbi:hypothetical protein BSI_27020 [Bacillus inaquosorum KCTC 13429]|uniref:Uncharacterized protein n=1 Tax=Bacillus inaquosorum KCTC 13429 TaxID=1236548 RepID=A0A9W5LI79_9BACI|nr:hypothetical protein BSI_27020 [Bacillus inaquosorum KCTC 13429]
MAAVLFQHNETKNQHDCWFFCAARYFKIKNLSIFLKILFSFL